MAVQTPSGCCVQARLSLQAPQASLLTRLSELPETHTPATSGPLPALTLERTIHLTPQRLPELFLTRLPEQAYSLLLTLANPRSWVTYTLVLGNCGWHRPFPAPPGVVLGPSHPGSLC